ncbi:glutamate--tRNA ligase, partial [Patescibacteria group bacterium]|nr:glutamate--tRNA ligase [Patescibacteria group bacterium]
RTALYNYLYARREGGDFILRIEDTDRERYVEGAVEGLIRVLDRIGLEYDEGPKLEKDIVNEVGDKGPYIQSDRTEIYREHVEVLLVKGQVYRCFCSPDRLDSMRKQQQLAKLPTKYDRFCQNLSEEEVTKRLELGEPFVVRMLVPPGKTVFEDVIRGKVTIDNTEVDDQVLLKSDGFPTYHLANVVDDHLMGITHVIRGEEWLPSTPKHVILYNMFGWDLPVFAHLPLILNPDKSKLSKRQGDVAVEDYLEKGYLPEALINFVATLGYNPKGDQEIYSLDEFVKLFELSKVNASGAIFNTEKLDWLNAHYIREKKPAELAKLCRRFVDHAQVEISDADLEKLVTIEQERLTRLDQIVAMTEIFQELEYEPGILAWKKADQVDAKENITKLIEFVETLGDFESVDMVEKAVKEYIEGKGLANGNVLWPMRVALSGAAASPGPFELAWALGRDETLKRLYIALEKLS